MIKKIEIKKIFDNFRNKISTPKKNGFTLLFAVLVSILILSVGASIINLAVKQIIISGSARESQFAFYAANTGIECALFWEINQIQVLGLSPEDTTRIFAYGNSEELNDSQQAIVKCAEGSIYDGISGGKTYKVESTSGTIESGNAEGTTSFWIDFKDSNDIGLPYCAYVIVRKNGGATIIDSYGYNTCDDSNPRRIERGLRVRI